MELQEELMKKADLTLTEADKMAVAKESAKFIQAAMTGESSSAIRSSYKQLKGGADNKPCKYCRATKMHKDRQKECPAWKSICSCVIPHHYQALCTRKGIPPPPREKGRRVEEDKPIGNENVRM